MIAEKLGCSQETVSHILGGGARELRYSKKARERVLRTARELGYRPHRGAQLMRSGKSNLIGIIHFGMGLEVAQQTAHYLPAELKARGYRALVVDLGWAADNARGAIDQLIEARVEGVIISQMVERLEKEDVEHLLQVGIPVVAIAGNEKLGVPVVFSEIKSAMKQLVEHLVTCGHRRLLHLLPNYRDARPIQERAQGFANGIRAAGGKVKVLDGSLKMMKGWLKQDICNIRGGIVYLDEATELDQTSTAYTYARNLFQGGSIPDVFVCCNDLWARGVFSAALEAGWTVPEKVAITGVDNEAFGMYPPYHLTTIAQSRKEECAKGVELLMELMEGKEPAGRQVAFPARLVIRRSCGTPLKSDA